MEQIKLYKYNGEHGCIVSPLELPMEFEPMIRLVSEPDKCLKNKDNGETAYVIDIYPNEIDKWEEIDKPEEDIEHTPSQPIDPDEISAEEFMDLVEEAL